MQSLLDRTQGVAPLKSVFWWSEGILLRCTEHYSRLQGPGVPPRNKCRDYSLVSARRNTEKIDDRHLVLESLPKPPVVRRVRVPAHEGVFDRFIARKNLAMNLA